MPSAPITTAYQQLQQWDQQVAIMQESNEPFFLFGSSAQDDELGQPELPEQTTDNFGQQQLAPAGPNSIDLYA